MPQQTFVLGMNAGLYQGPAGSDDPATMSEVDNVRDVNLTLEAGEADVTTRGNSGWRATAPTLRECQVEFQMVWRPGEAGFTSQKAVAFTWRRGGVNAFLLARPEPCGRAMLEARIVSLGE
ncbi:MAG TPA: hypothetical protein VM487_10915 [Phycisphaerae bacterium]|nr:hypothetical protein [Phycisphaerae bacterium]